MVTKDGQRIYRLPAWIKRTTQDLSVSPIYDAVFWNPPQEYEWKNKSPKLASDDGLRIYEAHGRVFAEKFINEPCISYCPF
jgi:1,4-alpha-glucan branching enzyme